MKFNYNKIRCLAKSRITIVVLFFIILTNVYSQQKENILKVYADQGKYKIDKNIYGHFTEHLGRCIYDGIWVGEDSPIPNIRGIRTDVVEALKEIEVPVVRWPGGCFADDYNWKEGIGPKDERPELVNLTWGGVEDNSYGTHEFLDFCELIGAEPYLAVNVASGNVREARDWVSYVNSTDGPMADLRRKNGRDEPWNVKYWGIGNESWGCGGNMTAQYYSDQYKQFATFCKGEFKIMSGGINDDLDWTETVMKNSQEYKKLVRGYSYHYYTICHDWTVKGSATDFNKDEWFNTMKKTFVVDTNLSEHCGIMDKYDPEKEIALIADEWGNWFDADTSLNPSALYQQNTLRDAVTAGLYLNIFNKHCDRVKMANIAQTVNVLQSVLLTNGEYLVKTPTFYVFKMYRVHQDATLLPSDLSCVDYACNNERIPSLNASASMDTEGKIHISIVNMDPDNPQRIKCEVQGLQIKKISGEIITSQELNAFNDFNKEEKVSISSFAGFKLKDGMLVVEMPAKSVVMLELND
ncbi:MAG: alpha-N-arabinofuranosidase [Bacteroidales bacterium]|nr:alpha-N-arabinofuranosidase [Bacteroidales bacterium]